MKFIHRIRVSSGTLEVVMIGGRNTSSSLSSSMSDGVATSSDWGMGW